MEIVESRSRSEIQFGKVSLKLAIDFRLRVGEFAGHEFAAAFKNADILSCARKPRCGDTSAVTGSDHDNGIMGFDSIDRQ
jgi:hypothetical protein